MLALFHRHLFCCRTEIQSAGLQGREISRLHPLQINSDWKSDKSKSSVFLQNLAFPESDHLTIQTWWGKAVHPRCVCVGNRGGALDRSRERNWSPKRGPEVVPQTRREWVKFWLQNRQGQCLPLYHTPSSDHSRPSGVTVKLFLMSNLLCCQPWHEKSTPIRRCSQCHQEIPGERPGACPIQTPRPRPAWAQTPQPAIAACPRIHSESCWLIEKYFLLWPSGKLFSVFFCF